jgi:hypothetical protein
MTPVHSGGHARKLLDRVRAWLPSEHVREVRMLGTIAVMVDDVIDKRNSALKRHVPNLGHAAGCP